MSGLGNGMRLQPTPQILVKKGIVSSLHSKLLLDGLNSATITQGMCNCFYLRMTKGASIINRDTSSNQTLLHPNTVLHASPYEHLNSRQRMESPKSMFPRITMCFLGSRLEDMHSSCQNHPWPNVSKPFYPHS